MTTQWQKTMTGHNGEVEGQKDITSTQCHNRYNNTTMAIHTAMQLLQRWQ